MVRLPSDWPIRLALFLGIGAAGFAALQFRESIGPRGQAAIGIPCFLALAVACSTNIRAISLRLVVMGIVLQFVLASLILYAPPVREAFRITGEAIQKFLDFTDEGARFVFGPLADPAVLGQAMGPANGFVFAFKALPAVIFVSSFFTVLYYLGVLQFVVKLLARVMVFVMGTSGSETLSSVANVFMGQTEAPLIVKPYVKGMTQSELLALMVGGMATISGGVMVAYVAMMQGAGVENAAMAILATSVMAAPCGLYLAKILLPETEVSETRGVVKAVVERTHANVFDAAADGASEGMKLVLNIAAMLIAFIAAIALVNHVLAKVDDGLNLGLDLTLQGILAKIFAPVAFLMGVPLEDSGRVGELLGTKLVLNEFVAYTLMTQPEMVQNLSPRSVQLTVYALTGFANFASIGIQLGGIGAMAPERRGDLARLGMRALFAGFLATVVNASVAGVLLPVQ